MAISLFDITVSSYLQVLGGLAGCLEKGALHADEHGLDLQQIVETRLHPDMLPFRFQLISVAHHSLGAVRGMQEGLFQPPPALPGLDYAGLQALVRDATGELQALSREEIDPLEGKSLVFRLGSMEIPFLAENFALSFSLPNLHFHATTAYDILRMAGVPLGKRDYLGQMRVGG